jgi:AbrB family looped-hinge helix DNA binding protein
MTSKGQVTIPQEIRERLQLLPHSEVEFEVKNGTAILRKALPIKGNKSRGVRLIELLRGKGSIKMTTDEILALTRK